MAEGAQADTAQAQVPARRRMSEATARRLKELEEWGVDLSLIASSLGRTPEQRLDNMLGRLELIDALRRGMERGKARHP